MKKYSTKGSGGCHVIPQTPSEECREYHKNSCVQINLKEEFVRIIRSEQEYRKWIEEE